MDSFTRVLRIFLFVCFSILVLPKLWGQGAIVNEISNGPAGTQEFFELVVVGPDANQNCGPVDLRGWILDDNNGDFSCGPCANSGIAPGHIRFASVGNWAAVPTGSIIVVYDPATKNPMIPADDPTDTAPADGVYILPNSHPSIEISTPTACAGSAIPTGLGACGACTGDDTYAGACYTVGATTNIGLRNSGDAAQVRMPSGAYFHGLAYGTGSSNMTGGPDGIFFGISGSLMYFAFNNTLSNDYRSSANYVAGTVASLGETPGAANSLLNAAWIASLTTPCLLPINYLKPFTVIPLPGRNKIEWATSMEYNSDVFKVMRSNTPTGNFVEVGRLEAAGTSNQITKYEFEDFDLQAERSWYRLEEVDHSGEVHVSEIVEAYNANIYANVLDVYPNPTNGLLQLKGSAKGTTTITLCDGFGKRMLEISPASDEDKIEAILDLSQYANGLYLLQMHTQSGIETRKVIVQH